MNAYIRRPKENELPIVRKVFLDVFRFNPPAERIKFENVQSCE